jgi:hypothetical protein
LFHLGTEGAIPIFNSFDSTSENRKPKKATNEETKEQTISSREATLPRVVSLPPPEKNPVAKRGVFLPNGIP